MLLDDIYQKVFNVEISSIEPPTHMLVHPETGSLLITQYKLLYPNEDGSPGDFDIIDVSEWLGVKIIYGNVGKNSFKILKELATYS